MKTDATGANQAFNQAIIELLLDGVSPFNNFPLENYEEKLQGWHSDSGIFEDLLEEIRPNRILEVGTWLGASAIRMADLCVEKKLSAPIVCVDTWLGSAEFWVNKRDPSRYQQLNLRYGYPAVYEQFMANVIHRQHDDRIVPFPQTSLAAGRVLASLGLSFPMIYIDGSHDEDDVYADLLAYWKILDVGGVIFGDDYDHYWPGVVTAVHRFADEMNVVVTQSSGFWSLRKKTGVSLPDPIRVANEVTALRIENSVLRAKIEAQNAKRDFTTELLIENQIEKGRAGFFHDQLLKCEEKLNASTGSSGTTNDEAS